MSKNSYKNDLVNNTLYSMALLSNFIVIWIFLDDISKLSKNSSQFLEFPFKRIIKIIITISLLR